MFNSKPRPEHMKDTSIFHYEDLSTINRFKLKRSKDYGIDHMRWTYDAIAKLVYKSHPQPSAFMAQLTKNSEDNKQMPKHGRFVNLDGSVLCIVDSYCNCVRNVSLQRRFLIDDQVMTDYILELFDSRND